MADARSGIITVTTAGTAVQGPATPAGSAFIIRGDPANTGTVYVGNDGSNSVSSTTGYALAKTDAPIEVNVASLDQLWFDAATNGDKVIWIQKA